MKYDEIVKTLSDATEGEALLCDGFEGALIGTAMRFGMPTVACYDYWGCITILMAQGMSEQEAVEYFEFNTIGAWVGEYTPVFVDIARWIEHDEV